MSSGGRPFVGAKAAAAANNVSFSVEEISTSDEDAAAATTTGDDELSFFSAQDATKTILLDVGGETFKTTRASLARVKGSFFEAMVSGRHVNATAAGAASEFFVDRDPTHFRHILNYLRTGAIVTLPESDAAKAELAIEADFYGLVDMVKAVKYPGLDVTDFLPPTVVAIQAEEKKMRSKHRRGHFANLSQFPHEKMICLLGDCNDGTYSLPLMYNPDHPLRSDKSSLFLSNVCPGDDTSTSTAATVKSFAEFETVFNKEFPNILHRLRDVLKSENVMIAGGAVLRALTKKEGTRTHNIWNRSSSDIDLFLYALPRDEANRVVRRICNALAVDNEIWVIIRSRGVINIHSEAVKVQIVLRIYSSPVEVLIGFDVDCCCCSYDGSNVWVTKRCATALESGVNVLNPLHAWPNKPSYELRLGKYVSRGFAIFAPGIQNHRVDFAQIKAKKLQNLKGLARLIKTILELAGATKKEDVWNFAERNWREIEYQPAPLQSLGLSKDARREMTADEILVGCRSGYDDLPESLLVPEIYAQGREVAAYQWFDYYFARAAETRDAAIEAIIDCVSAGQDPPEGVPAKLFDAWITEKRSREYLNDELDKFDLDAIYYEAAYKAEA